jgi:ADP-ribose pyrophosphatase YjhB (NUDIX family)
MRYLPDDLYGQIERSMPIACVDFVPVRVDPNGLRHVGLILRDSPHGRVWCHLGGRVQYGETIRNAIRRHAEDTLGALVNLEFNPQPAYVYEWFPGSVAPTDGTVYGDDPRKHAIGLSFVVELIGQAIAKHEALDFAYFPASELPAPIWPGCFDLIDRLRLL